MNDWSTGISANIRTRSPFPDEGSIAYRSYPEVSPFAVLRQQTRHFPQAPQPPAPTLGRRALILGARLYPLLAMAGGTALLLQLMNNRLGKALAKSRIGLYMTSASLALGVANDWVAGVHLQQPAMLAAGVLQAIPPILLACSGKNTAKAYAINLWMFLCAFWQLGFLNEMNNSKAAFPQEKRLYPLARLRHFFSPSSPETLGQRIQGVAGELGRMGQFILQDHKVLFQPLGDSDHSGGSGSWYSAQNLTRLSILMTYLGTLPGLLVPKLYQKPLLDFAPSVLKAMAILLANISVMQVAAKQDSLWAKLPMIGVPLSALGNAVSGNPWMMGIGRIGEGLNNSFFSELALNGLQPEKPSR